VGSCDPRSTSAAEMAEMMVGKSLATPARDNADHGEIVLKVSGLSVEPASPFGTPLRHIGIELHAGEVLGIGGVAGNGQDELLAALSGEVTTAAGTVTLHREPIGNKGPNERRALGLLCGPEERLGHAAAPDMSLVENALLTARQRKGLDRRGFIDWSASRSYAEEVIETFDVRTPGPDNAARSLSGGNLQKFVIGREILQDPGVLVVNQPTWGVDAAAAAAIRQAILDLAQKGAGVIVISQDLDELLEVSDNFAALNEGRLSNVRSTKGLTMETIGLMLGGAHDMHEASEETIHADA
jgi:simple sugar transport system ATP-binding protein